MAAYLAIYPRPKIKWIKPYLAETAFHKFEWDNRSIFVYKKYDYVEDYGAMGDVVTHICPVDHKDFESKIIDFSQKWLSERFHGIKLPNRRCSNKIEKMLDERGANDFRDELLLINKVKD